MIPADVALLRTPGTPAVSPDGTTVVVSVIRPDPETDEYVGQLWRVAADGSSPPVRLTRGHRDTAPAWSPDGRRVTFVRAEPKGKPQVHVVEAEGGEPVCLTDAPLGTAEPRFSPDGSRVAYLARVPDAGRYVPGGDAGAEPPRHITSFRYRADSLGFFRDRPQHLFVIDVPADPDPGARPTPHALTSGDIDVSGHRWMPDGQHLVAVSALHPGREEDLRQDAVLVDARPPSRDGADGVTVDGPGEARRAPVPLTDAANGSDLAVATVAPSADGRTLWLLASDQGPSGLEFVAAQTGLYSLDLAALADAPEAHAVVRPVRRTDVEAVDLMPGILAVAGDEVLVADQRRGAVVLIALPVADPDGVPGAGRVLCDSPTVILGLDATTAGTSVVVSAAAPGSSGDVMSVHPRGGALTRLTDLSADLRATGRLVTPQEITATAPDGYPVHGWVALPDASRHGPGPHPVVLMIHGGPYAQYTYALFDEVQVLTEAGYAVVYGNPRGSAGYGAAHGTAIRHAFGTVDTDDVLALLDRALEDPDLSLDRERTGVMGGSYGGYLTAWLTTRTERFVAAIVERGFLDPVSFVGSSDIGWFFGLAYLGDNDSPAAAEGLAAQSPIAEVSRVRTPTLVIHSENDWRCPVEQGQRWFVELRRRGIPSELLLFPGEGHELTRSGRPRHRVARFEHVLEWWTRRMPAPGENG